MKYKYLYGFHFIYAAPSDILPTIHSALYVERSAPMDSRLYYKIRKKAFGAMNEKYWSCNVIMYVITNTVVFPPSFENLDSMTKGCTFDFTRYNATTCHAVIAPLIPGKTSKSGTSVRSCWNWVDHDEPYDWKNHTKYNPSMRT